MVSKQQTTDVLAKLKKNKTLKDLQYNIRHNGRSRCLFLILIVAYPVKKILQKSLFHRAQMNHHPPLLLPLGHSRGQEHNMTYTVPHVLEYSEQV